MTPASLQPTCASAEPRSRPGGITPLSAVDALNVPYHVELIDPCLVEAGPAIDDVTPMVACEQAIVACAAAEDAPTFAAVGPVVSDATLGDVVSREGVHRVVATPAEQDVVARSTVERVRTTRSHV